MRSRYSVQKRMLRHLRKRYVTPQYNEDIVDEGMTLIFFKTKEIVKVGDIVSNRNYVNCVVRGGRAPRLVGSAGHVLVEYSSWKQEFLADVFDLKWVPNATL